MTIFKCLKKLLSVVLSVMTSRKSCLATSPTIIIITEICWKKMQCCRRLLFSIVSLMGYQSSHRSSINAYNSNKRSPGIWEKCTIAFDCSRFSRKASLKLVEIYIHSSNCCLEAEDSKICIGESAWNSVFKLYFLQFYDMSN